jgi:large subunit ribosomal protein L25
VIAQVSAPSGLASQDDDEEEEDVAADEVPATEVKED